MVFPIDTSMIESSSVLQDSDIGKWCFYVNGGLCGFCRTRQEAEALYGWQCLAECNGGRQGL